MITYKGVRTVAAGPQTVYRDEDGKVTVLDPRPSQKLWNHSPDGFQWSFGGSGPAQLALALMLDATDDAEVAKAHYQDFKWQFVAGWGDQWHITALEILTWLQERLCDPKQAAVVSYMANHFKKPNHKN